MNYTAFFIGFVIGFVVIWILHHLWIWRKNK
jgi:putative flippase GtrA